MNTNGKTFMIIDVCQGYKIEKDAQGVIDFNNLKIDGRTNKSIHLMDALLWMNACNVGDTIGVNDYTKVTRIK